MDASEAALLLLARKVLSGSGSNGAKGESSEDCIHKFHKLQKEDHDSSTHKHKQELLSRVSELNPLIAILVSAHRTSNITDITNSTESSTI